MPVSAPFPSTRRRSACFVTTANRQLEERLAIGRSYTDLDLVFPDTDGSVFNPENLSKRFHRRVEKLALPRIRSTT